MIRAADTAKERLVTRGGSRIHVSKLLRGVANELNEFGRDGLRVTRMLLFGVLGCGTSAAKSGAAAERLPSSVRHRMRALHL